MHMHYPSTQIKHVKFNIYPSIFYKPYFVDVLTFPECMLSSLNFCILLFHYYGPRLRQNEPPFKKKEKNNSNALVSDYHFRDGKSWPIRMQENQ